MNTVKDVVSWFGGAPRLSERIEVAAPTIRKWISRESIPPVYWSTLVSKSADVQRERSRKEKAAYGRPPRLSDYMRIAGKPFTNS